MNSEDIGMTLIRVTLFDSHAMSTILRTYAHTTAGDLHAILSTKLDISEDTANFFSLILIHSVEMDVGPTRFIVRTIQSSEKVLDVVKNVEDAHKVEGKGDAISSFYFKDVRSAPLEFDGDVSGTESSDDEEVSPSDLNYLKQCERKGFLLVQSSIDPHLYRKRWCVLGEKLWAISLSKQTLKSRVIHDCICITKDDCTFIVSESVKKSVQFRAQSMQEQELWTGDLLEKALNKMDDDILMMAETIICDEEYTRESRLHTNLPSVSCNGVPNDYVPFCISKRIREIDEEYTNSIGSCMLIQHFRELYRHDLNGTVEEEYKHYYAMKILRIFGSYFARRFGEDFYRSLMKSIKLGIGNVRPGEVKAEISLGKNIEETFRDGRDGDRNDDDDHDDDVNDDDGNDLLAMANCMASATLEGPSVDFFDEIIDAHHHRIFGVECTDGI